METITNGTFDKERAFYGANGLTLLGCTFDGPADGESAVKEASDIHASDCLFNLRYPFWHDKGVQIENCELTPLCRAALWYSRDIEIKNTRLHGIKALRECDRASLTGCDIDSPEFGWSVREALMRDCTAQSEYFMLRSSGLDFDGVRMKGKYSFQYIENAVFNNCVFDTKDAFWHSKNVTVRNSVLRGEYLAWYSESLTLVNCKISGTQPFCCCRGLRLCGCELTEADLCFEKSEVDADITTPVISIKNPRSGTIRVPSVGEIIRDEPDAQGEIIVNGKNA